MQPNITAQGIGGPTSIRPRILVECTALYMTMSMARKPTLQPKTFLFQINLVSAHTACLSMKSVTSPPYSLHFKPQFFSSNSTTCLLRLSRHTTSNARLWAYRIVMTNLRTIHKHTSDSQTHSLLCSDYHDPHKKIKSTRLRHTKQKPSFHSNSDLPWCTQRINFQFRCLIKKNASEQTKLNNQNLIGMQWNA